MMLQIAETDTAKQTNIFISMSFYAAIIAISFSVQYPVIHVLRISGKEDKKKVVRRLQKSFSKAFDCL